MQTNCRHHHQWPWLTDPTCPSFPDPTDFIHPPGCFLCQQRKTSAMILYIGNTKSFLVFFSIHLTSGTLVFHLFYHATICIYNNMFIFIAVFKFCTLSKIFKFHNCYEFNQFFPYFVSLLKDHEMYMFFPGGSLDKYCQVPQSVLGKITCQVVQGLQYLWSLKILHRGKFVVFFLSVNIWNSETDRKTSKYLAPRGILYIYKSQI